VVNFITPISIGEDLFGPAEQLFLPGMDESRMDSVEAGQLVDGFVASEGGECHLSLERRRVLLPLSCHLYPFPGPPK
jgi:hypothetical protein